MNTIKEYGKGKKKWVSTMIVILFNHEGVNRLGLNNKDPTLSYRPMYIHPISRHP